MFFFDVVGFEVVIVVRVLFEVCLCDDEFMIFDCFVFIVMRFFLDVFVVDDNCVN